MYSYDFPWATISVEIYSTCPVKNSNPEATLPDCTDPHATTCQRETTTQLPFHQPASIKGFQGPFSIHDHVGLNVSSMRSRTSQNQTEKDETESSKNDGAQKFAADDQQRYESSPLIKDTEAEKSKKDMNVAPLAPKDVEVSATFRSMSSLMDACENSNKVIEEAFSKATIVRNRHSISNKTPETLEEKQAYTSFVASQHDSKGKIDLAETPPTLSIHHRWHNTIQSSSVPKGAKWNNFIRKGARLKNLLDSAIHKVTSGTAEKMPPQTAGSKRPLSSANGESPIQEPPVRSRVDEHAAELARERTVEVTILKKKLKEAQAHSATLLLTNATLREAASASSERMERTAEALRIAGTNAANARADADAAEANSAVLSNQLQALKNVVDETKRATQILYAEHEQVSTAVHSVETKLLQTESENGRLKKEKRRLAEERDGLLEKTSAQEELRFTIEAKLRDNTDQLDKMKQTVKELEAVKQARMDRSHQLEKELRETRAMLVEASATSAETETTVALLNDTIEELRKANMSLHEQMETMQDSMRKDHERLNESSNKIQSDAQQLRIKCAADSEEIERLRLDKAACEAEITQLKNRISNLERRLQDATIPHPTPTSISGMSSQGHPDQVRKRESGSSFLIPPLASSSTSPKIPATGKENKGIVSTSKSSGKCCLCYKEAFGLMKSCQCGNRSCNKRAHTMCLAGSTAHAGPSVSHPGTPAPRLPVVLCGNIKP